MTQLQRMCNLYAVLSNISKKEISTTCKLEKKKKKKLACVIEKHKSEQLGQILC